MKKFLIIFLILILAGGAAFFFGWAQLSVPAGAYGVLQSKSHGVDPRLVEAGQFRWIWYKLIPTNVTITAFEIEPVRRTVSARGSLPSGETYSAFAGEETDFSWELNASFSFSLRPDSLPAIVAENKITSQEELLNYERALADSVESFIVRSLRSGENANRLETLLADEGAAIENAAKEQFPGIRDFSCIIKDIRFPNFALYQQVRGLYEDYIASQRNYATAAMSEKAASRIETQARFDELERYGELLTKYPILLDYLTRVENQSPE